MKLIYEGKIGISFIFWQRRRGNMNRIKDDFKSVEYYQKELESL